MLSDKFIALGEKYNTIREHVAAPYMRKSFFLSSVPQKAEITVCGLGFYVLWINGENITKGALAPYISNPDQIMYYDRYDVTDKLNKGENVIGLMLGNGMQNADTHVWDFDKNAFRSAPKVALSFEADGKTMFEADDGFTCHPSPVTYDDLRAGERYDARLEIPGWLLPGFDDKDWLKPVSVPSNKGEKRICTASPVLKQKELKPVSVRRTLANHYVYDFGENNSGVARLKIKGKCGQTVRIIFGEIANDEGVDQSNISFGPETISGYIQHIEYTLKGGGTEEYTPFFTYFGFRYAEVSGITPQQAGLDLLTYVVLSGDMPSCGEFVTSDETVNRIQDITLRSDYSNFYYFPTDCPHREKNGWTGDAALSAQQFLMNFDAEASLAEWMRCICRAQREDGALPGIVPTGGWGFKWGSGPAWDIAIVAIPYMLYRINGNLDCFKESADSIYKYIEYIPTVLNKDGLAEYGLIDWCEVNSLNSTPLVITDTLTLLNLCDMAEKLFIAAGDKKRAENCKKLFLNLKSAFRKKHMDLKTKSVIPATQSGQAMAMYYGAFDKEEMPEALIRLKELIAKYDGHFQVGVLGARVLFRVLSDMGEAELAYSMITRPDFPSYGWQVTMGFTALLESIKKLTVKAPFTECLFEDGSVGGRSLNHHFWGDVSGWFYETIGGLRINPCLTSWRDVVIDPCFIKSLDYAKATHVYKGIGTLTVEWKRENEKIKLTVTVPEGINATYSKTGKKLSAGVNEIIV